MDRRQAVTMPVLFIGHGAPDILLKQDPILEEWKRQIEDLPRPQRILVVSAHWETESFAVSGNARRETLHDFHGFPQALYEYRYRPPADDDWAHELARGLGCRFEPERGLDHAAWVPLMALYPEQDIPVSLLSVSPSLGMAAHHELGKRLTGYRDQGVLILASGVIVHNLSRLFWQNEQAQPEGWASSFMDAVEQALREQDSERLVEPEQMPAGELAVPTPEHYLPLLVAFGAAAGDAPRAFAREWRYSNLALHCFRWG